MNGIVNAELELTIDTYIRGPKGEAPITAIIDTGYNGYLSLPFHLVDMLALPRLSPRAVTLSDGSYRMFTYYELEIEWNGHFKNIQALCMPGDPLIGTALLKGFKLEADFVVRGVVRVAQLVRLLCLAN